MEVSTISETLQSNLLPCISAFGACLAFAPAFNIHGIGTFICGAGGALGWLVYLLAGESVFAAFLSAIVIGFFSEIMAKLRRCPVTSYVLVALLPLVPGGGIYHAMRHCVTGESQQFLSTLLHTFGMAAALAVGAMLASSVFRATVSLFQSNRGHGSRRRGTGPQQTP